MGSKVFDIVTKPSVDLVFNSHLSEPSTIDIAVHNPNHASTLAYYVRITHPADFIVVPSKGLLEPGKMINFVLPVFSIVSVIIMLSFSGQQTDSCYPKAEREISS